MLKVTKFGEVTRFDSARTIAGKGYYWTTAYLVGGMVVDTGCAHSSGEMAEALAGNQVACIVNTHSHEDHIGANGILQKEHEGLDILAHPLALPTLNDPRSTQWLQPYRRLFWGWPEPSNGKPVEDGDLIEVGDYCFQINYTPGHSPDHLCLYEQERGWLFTGDLFVGGRDRALRADYDIWQIIASLKKVANLPLTAMFPGSARVRNNPKQDLLGKIDYLEKTGEKVLKLERTGRSTKAIAKTVFGGPMLIEYITLGHFTRVGLVKSYLRGDKQHG